MKATNVIPTKIVLHQALAGISVSNWVLWKRQRRKTELDIVAAIWLWRTRAMNLQNTE
jgi:hypothetical protein